ncbi:MAG: FAD-dependent oxidoreductase [Micromonosporaceae bacterium]
MTNRNDELPTVVIGAGPVGLAAAAHLAERGLDFLVLEAGTGVAAAIEEWRQVRLFSPWRYDIDAAARRLLDADGWVSPDPDALPTGGELVDAYLQPLAKLPALANRIRYGARVAGITRLGFDRMRSAGREQAPFLVRLESGEELVARSVIDASGTWRTPNVLGGYGLPGRGEREAGELIVAPLPDVLDRDRERFAGRRVVVVGAGHSAATTLLELADPALGSDVTWAIRGKDPRRVYGGGDADELPARGRLGTRLHALVDAGRVTLVADFAVEAVERDGDSVVLVAASGERLTADVVVNATGFRPDHAIAAELRLDLDPILGATRALAPLIDPNQHSCGTVPPHGVEQLSHPDTGYYAVGVKSYGRAPTFLLATGYEQIRSVVAALAGDWDAARDVRLELPETGVCSTAAPREAGRGLATGLRTASTVLPLAETTTGGCCG